MADCVRDEIIEQLQLHGRQPAKKIAEAIGRNEKVVMRVMTQLVDDGTVVFDVVPEVRMLRLRYWCWRRSAVRYYRFPVPTTKSYQWGMRWTK